MNVNLYQFYKAHVEWVGKRKTLKGPSKRYFYRWVAVEHSELISPFKGQMALFRQQCLEVHRGLTPLVKKGLSMTIITRYAEPLTARYLSLLDSGVEEFTFSYFLDKVLEECLTERALRSFLGL